MAKQPSFKEIDWQKAEEDDNNAIEKILKGAGEGEQILNDDRELELGEKADDAEDFEDIGDDDLPDEEEPTIKKESVEQCMEDMDVDEDDLFGDGGRASSPLENNFDVENVEFMNVSERSEDVNTDIMLPTLEPEPEIDLHQLNFPPNFDIGEDILIPDDVEEVRKLVREKFPLFDPDGIPFWNQLLATKNEYWIPLEPLKPPKPFNPTKVSLDLAIDQEKSFRGSAPLIGDKHRQIADAYMKGLIMIENEMFEPEDSEDEFDYSYPDPSDKVGGYTLGELDFICADFENATNVVCMSDEEEKSDEPMDEWEREIFGHTSKLKRKASTIEKDFTIEPRYPVPSFDNFEEMTAQVAKRVIIDLNDPYLLVDFQDYDSKSKRKRLSFRTYSRTGQNDFTLSLASRFNYSNDEAYEALKENHQSKVRATLGHLTIEHAMPALKLQWPYYQVKLYIDQARSFHRPSLKFKRFLGQVIHFSKPGMRKKKAVKGMHTHEIFKETKDLSLADHYSTATLFEYSEEHPTVLSGFGMGNRIINYYRRRNADDSERPQPEDKIGDTTVLLPEDRSPFSNFGMVDPGQTVRTLHNGMFRAPIFKHESKKTDFLCIRNSTGVEGTKWYIRNIENIFVVGQQLPSIEIPGPHSRKVTNAAKNRMKMIAYRKIRHSPNQNVKIADITAHITDSTDMQNRQKLKEFMIYDKVEKVWKLPPGDPIRDEAQIRSMIKPEDVCVLDAMQVGSRYLEDAGFEANDDNGKDFDVLEGDTEESLEQSLAPWSTTKSFLDASADKAMLALKGPGDPSGCGLALSFLKTSMKGGFLQNLGKDKGDINLKAKEALDPSKNGGHTYNVKLQQNIYNNTIREIWDAQMANLSDPNEHHLTQEELEKIDTPRGIHFDDAASQYTSMSTSEKIMRITRKYKNKLGQVEQVTETVTDARIWKAYQKRRIEIDTAGKDVTSFRPTGDPEKDEAQKRAIKKELARLNKNRVRRHVREKQKGRINTPQATSPGPAGSPSSILTPSIETATGTTRKCANCGQAGHIKTNKKLCPMLNGAIKQYDSNPKHGGFGSISTPSF